MNDPDIERWTAAWREGTPPGADLARRARRERRWLLAWVACDWIVGIAFIALAASIWMDNSSPGLRFVAVAVVGLILAALGFTVHNWRGSLGGDSTSATDFLALSRRRSKARRRYVRVGWLLLAANLVVITIAVSIDHASKQPGQLSATIAFACLATAVAAGILWFWGLRERRRAKRLEAMQKAMESNAENGHE